jgi:hypothetical protein
MSLNNRTTNKNYIFKKAFFFIKYNEIGRVFLVEITR